MEDFFNEYIEPIESYKWVGVKDISRDWKVSERTIFKWLKDGKFESIKFKGKRLISVPSLMGFLLKKKCIEMEQIRNRELKQSIESKMYFD